MTVPEDRIENEIVIAAPIERVWAVVTEAEHMGNWFGIGEPAKADLRPGGEMVLVHNRSEHGTLVARIERVEPPRFFSYRWSQSHPEEQPDDGCPRTFAMTGINRTASAGGLGRSRTCGSTPSKSGRDD